MINAGQYQSHLRFLNKAEGGKQMVLNEEGDLSNSIFQNVNLEGASLEQYFHKAEFISVSLNKAKWRGEMTSATLKGCPLHSANMSYMKCNQTHFRECNLQSIVVKGTRFQNCFFEDCTFLEADLEDNLFQHCYFKNCDLSDVDLSRSCFVECLFNECNLLGAQLLSSRLQGSDLRRSNLVGVHLDGILL